MFNKKTIILCTILCSSLLTIANHLENATPVVIDDINSLDVRIARATGERRNPTLISLAIASSNTEKAVELLKNSNLFYNVIIDLINHKVYYFTNDATKNLYESCEKTRSRAVGISTYTDRGYLQRNDLNTESITIGLVQEADTLNNQETYNFFTSILAELCDQFNIAPHRVLSYPMLAVNHAGAYERVDMERNHPVHFKKLAEQGFGLWPKQEDLEIKNPYNLGHISGQKKATIWTALALNKTGMIAAVTSNNNHPQLRSTITAFQKHYFLTTQDGMVNDETMLALNSILKQKETFESDLAEIEPKTLENIGKQHPAKTAILVDTLLQKIAQEETTK